MKNKYWILIFGAIFALCLILAFLPSLDAPSQLAQIKHVNHIKTVDLSVDAELVFESADGSYNTVTIQDGKIAVTQADCPDHYCMKRGFCHSGADIVCLPNRLVIHFTEVQEIDAVIG